MELLQIPLDNIAPNPQQPRTTFEEGPMQELAASIASEGVLTPIEVEPDGKGGYVLHHGERRVRAARMVGLPTIPAVVVGALEELDMALRALIENIMRQDLNPVEEGQAYQRLLDSGLSQAEISRRTGRAPATIQNRLAWFNEESKVVRDMVAAGELPVDVRVYNALQRLTVEERDQLAPHLAGQSVSGVQTAVQVIRQKQGGGTDLERKHNEHPTTRRRPYALTLVFGESDDNDLPKHVTNDVARACLDCSLSAFPAGAVCMECPLTRFVRLQAKRVSA